MGHYIIKALLGPHWPNMVNGFGGRSEGGGGTRGGGRGGGRGYVYAYVYVLGVGGGGGGGGGWGSTRLQEHHLEKYKSSFYCFDSV